MRIVLFAAAVALSAVASYAQVADEAVDPSVERLMRLTMVGGPSKLDKAADVLTRQGWKWVELHGDDRKPNVQAWRMSKTDNATVASMMAQLHEISATYGVKVDKVEVSPTAPKAR